MRFRPTILAVLCAAGLVTTACGSSSTSGGGGPATPAAPSPSLQVSAPPLSLSSDEAAKTVAFTLVAGYDTTNSGFNFDGYGKGRLAITVPSGWKVTVTCQNKGPLNHSCAIVKAQSATTPVFDGAASADPVRGLGAGQSGTFTFTPTAAGSYRIACLVPGHEQGGMWDTFVVTSSGTPSAQLSGWRRAAPRRDP